MPRRPWRVQASKARRRALAGVAAGAEQVLVTAAVAEDIPQDWDDAARIDVTMREDETGRTSAAVVADAEIPRSP